MRVSSSTSDPARVGEAVWEIPAGARPGMRVPARIFADEDLLTLNQSHGTRQLRLSLRAQSAGRAPVRGRVRGSREVPVYSRPALPI
jgi:hypothetical protein